MQTLRQVRVRSFASRNQLAADPRDRAGQALEWDRHYVTVLGVANQRLYSFRLQTASDTYERAQARPGHRCVSSWRHLIKLMCFAHVALTIFDHVPACLLCTLTLYNADVLTYKKGWGTW